MRGTEIDIVWSMTVRWVADCSKDLLHAILDNAVILETLRGTQWSGLKLLLHTVQSYASLQRRLRSRLWLRAEFEEEILGSFLPVPNAC